MTEAFRQRLNKIQSVSLLSGILGLAACLAGLAFGVRQFFASYLFAYLFWLGLALGCFALLMLHNLTGGRWGYPVRRFFEAGMRTIPWMALLFIPLLFGLRELYPWARPAEVAANEILQNKQHYMNAPGYILRTGFYFLVWTLLAHLLGKWSAEQDRTADPAATIKMRTLSGPGIVLYPLTATFAYIDWVMSLEADWFSTIFPVIVLIGQILTALAFVLLLLAWFRLESPFAGLVSTTHLHHLGNLLLAFVMFWTYVSFSQLLIIWSGNLPHEIEWYLHRSSGGWKWLVLFLAAFHFFIPFFLLLFRSTKRNQRPLTVLAGMIFCAHLLDVFWMVQPGFERTGLRLHWLHLAAPVGVGGVWFALFIRNLKHRPLVPQ
ncbi:MAG TPA: hypothetical protein VMZ27_05700, partial [Candidatus Saccharimonadales bacterium]|nr:hypothetical protein [Candidatus Saccharimonadales bacterium]